MKQYLVTKETMDKILGALEKAPFEVTTAVLQEINKNVKIILPKITEKSSEVANDGQQS